MGISPHWQQFSIFGESFNLPFGAYTADDNISPISGILKDGYWVEMGRYQNGQTFGNFISDQATLTLVRVTEPETILLLGSGLIGLIGFRKKFKK